MPLPIPSGFGGSWVHNRLSYIGKCIDESSLIQQVDHGMLFSRWSQSGRRERKAGKRVMTKGVSGYQWEHSGRDQAWWRNEGRTQNQSMARPLLIFFAKCRNRSVKTEEYKLLNSQKFHTYVWVLLRKLAWKAGRDEAGHSSSAFKRVMGSEEPAYSSMEPVQVTLYWAPLSLVLCFPIL